MSTTTKIVAGVGILLFVLGGVYMHYQYEAGAVHPHAPYEGYERVVQ